MRAQMPCQTVEDLIRAEEAARKKLDSLYNDPELLDALARDPDPEFHALVDRQRKEATAEWKRVRLALERITRLPLDWERGGGNGGAMNDVRMQTPISWRNLISCPICGGSGLLPTPTMTNAANTCPMCLGAGRVWILVRQVKLDRLAFEVLGPAEGGQTNA